MVSRGLVKHVKSTGDWVFPRAAFLLGGSLLVTSAVMSTCECRITVLEKRKGEQSKTRNNLLNDSRI